MPLPMGAGNCGHPRYRADADIVRLRIGTTFWPLTFAQRALCAAAILARDFADIRRLRVGLAVPP